jgi:AraC-like DNA-binding protein
MEYIHIRMEYIEQVSEFSPDISFLRMPGAPPRIPFCIRTLGQTQAKSTHVSKGTFFGDVMLTWFPKGHGEFIHYDGRIRIIPGMLGLVLPEEGESLLKADVRDPYTHFYCRFAGEEALKMSRMARAIHPAPFFIHPRAREAGRLLEEMVTWGISWEPGVEAQCMKPAEAKLALLLSMLCEEKANSKPVRSGLDRSVISEYILQHLSEPVSVDEAAAHFKMSKSYFCREVKRWIGITYQKAVEHEKMVLAASLLRDGRLNLTVSEVAYRVGYNDPLYFSKVFKRIYGNAPSTLTSKTGHGMVSARMKA